MSWWIRRQPITLTKKMFGISADIPCIAGQPTLIGNIDIRAQEALSFGYGNGGQNSAIGRICMNLVDKNDVDHKKTLPGTIVLEAHDADGQFLTQIGQYSSIKLARGWESSRQQDWTVFNATGKAFGQDNKLQIFFYADENCTIDGTYSDIYAMDGERFKVRR